jgi:hypothetical protein
MGKVILMVVIIYSNQPSKTYRGATEGKDDCQRQEVIIAKNPPIDENMTKFMIGCSFEEPIPDVAL